MEQKSSAVFATYLNLCIYTEMKKLVGIGEAAGAMGVSIATMRRWELEGRVKAVYTPGGHRRYDLATIKQEMCRAVDAGERKTVAYARVSNHVQKDDLDRQKQVLELYCSQQGWPFEVIADVGSGMDYRRNGLKQLLGAIVDDQIGRLVIANTDRLLRFGSEMVFAICEAKQVEVVILNQGEDTETLEEDLANDVRDIIAVFSARLYGARSHKNQKMLDGMQSAVEDASSA